MNDIRTTIIPPRPKLVFTDDRSVQLLGIELRLTRGEHALLRLISDRTPQTVAADDAGLSSATMAATVCNINKKAAIISGRKLMELVKDDGTVDNCHPTDGGFLSMSCALEEVLREIII